MGEPYEYGLRTPSPKRSASKRSPCAYSDRLIPSRAASDLECGLNLLDLDEHSKLPSGTPELAEDENNAVYTRLLRSELLGIQSPAPVQGNEDEMLRTPDRRKLFRYKSEPEAAQDDAGPVPPLLSLRSGGSPEAPTENPRKIPKEPFRVLHAPQLQDDFYLNPLDCSAADVLAVGLGACVDLWNVRTNRATRLLDLGQHTTVSSVSWDANGDHLAVGTKDGAVQIWDPTCCCKVRSMAGHRGRVGALAWNGFGLSTGGQDRHILHRDIRQRVHSTRWQGHDQEVCSLRWSHDWQQLASGGHEGGVCIWSAQSKSPEFRFNGHEAAVKAISWSPHQRGLLASGGGTADKCIRFWNTLRGVPISCVPTCSQVSNLAWSQSADEIVSTHGYSSNEIVVWRHPSMTRVATLGGHGARVLYLAVMADGQSIVTGAGDETLRFWNVFRGPRPRTSVGSSLAAMPSLSRTIR